MTQPPPMHMSPAERKEKTGERVLCVLCARWMVWCDREN
jgi:hypothetical protein